MKEKRIQFPVKEKRTQFDEKKRVSRCNHLSDIHWDLMKFLAQCYD